MVGDVAGCSAFLALVAVSGEDLCPEAGLVLGAVAAVGGVASANIAVVVLLLFVGVAFAAGGGWFAAAGL